MAFKHGCRSYWRAEVKTEPLSEAERQSCITRIRNKIAEATLTYTWLIRRLSDEGLLTDKFEMSSILAGTRRGSKVDEILRRSVFILDSYQERNGFGDER